MPGRVLVLHPYWDFWESSVAWDLRADREDLLDQACRILGTHCEVVRSRVVATSDDAESAVQGLADIDAIVVVSTMAAPPAHSMLALDRRPRDPVVVWALSRGRTLSQDFGHTDITTAGSTVGAPMIASALARQGRAYRVVASTLEEPGLIGGAVRGAVAAGRVQRARLLRIGDAIPGYSMVVPPEGAWDTFGPTVVDFSPNDFALQASQADPGEVASVIGAIEGSAVIDDGVDRLGLTRAAAVEVALRAAVREFDCVGGAINCHVAALRPSPKFGIAPCLALGRLTSDGYPFTCTGDLVTALAMVAVQSLELPTLYHEIEALDYERNEAILANTGEYDRRLCGSEPLEVIRNVWFDKDPIPSPSARFSIPAGPASLVAFTFAPRPRFVVAEGSFTGRRAPETGTPNAGFRFASGPLDEAWARWAQAGVVHHSAATNAHVADQVETLAHHLGAEFVRV